MNKLSAFFTALLAILVLGCPDSKTSSTGTKNSGDAAASQDADAAVSGGNDAATSAALDAAMSSAGNTFTIKSYGTFKSPTDQGGPVTQVTDKLQFAYIGSKGTAKADNGGGNIYFPMGATTGMYTVKVSPNGAGLGAHEVALDMSGGVADHGIVNVAQSGMVSLTVTGMKYTIVFDNLPSLDGNMRADQLSGHFSW